MQSPVRIRRGIPFFYDKSEAEFRTDTYERYEDMVVRQTLLHLADEVWRMYPYQNILDWINENLPTKSDMKIADIGCSVGRLIGGIAENHPDSQCHGLDYSYQMLRQAQDLWVKGKTIDLDLSQRGFENISIKGKNLPNLDFGLAKAEKLPFDTGSLDAVCNSFLLDRVEEPLLVLKEMYRVLKVGGILLSVTPFNFQMSKNWKEFSPYSKFEKKMKSVGFHLNKDKKEFRVKEYLDVNRNAVEWKCIAFSAQKE